MDHLVSILIPAYNSAKWIRESVSSAVNQTWRQKEIIVVDDGSTDETFLIAKQFASDNVKVVTQRNAGAPGARNRALTLAQGDYIQWLDADDVLHPEKISRQLQRATEGRDSLTLLTSAWGKFFFRTDKARFQRDALWQDLAPLEWIATRLERNAWMNPAVWLVSRRLTELAGPWDDRLASSGDDDGEYICRVAAASDSVRFVEDAKCYYRIGTVGSLNWNMETNDKALESLLLSLALTTQTLLNLEDSDRTRRAALKHLQTFSFYFLGNDQSYFNRLKSLAAELGGALEPPKLSWKYYPAQVAFGPNRAKILMRNWRAAKLIARRNVDWCLYRAGL